MRQIGAENRWQYRSHVYQNTVADSYGIAPCGAFTVYPAGYDSSQLSEAIVGWSHAWYDSMPAKLETPIIVNAEDTNLGSESQQDAFFQSKYLE